MDVNIRKKNEMYKIGADVLLVMNCLERISTYRLSFSLSLWFDFIRIAGHNHLVGRSD